MDKPLATGANPSSIKVDKWISYIPAFPRQPTTTTFNNDQLPGHPLPQGQATPLSQVISRPKTRPSNTKVSTKGAFKAKKSFTCLQCGKKNKDQWTLSDHMLKHSTKQEHMCKFCGTKCKRRKDLLKHALKTCPVTSQADAAPPHRGTRNTQRSEPGETQFDIVTPSLYQQRFQNFNRSEADLESESGNEAMVFDPERHTPLPWDPFLFLDSSFALDTLPQPTMPELDNVPQGGNVDLDVIRALSDPVIAELAEGEPISRQTETIHIPHSTSTLSTCPNPRRETGSAFQFPMPTPSFSSGTGRPNDVGVPPLDDGTESESPPPSSLNTSIPHLSPRLSLQDSKIVQRLQANDKFSSADHINQKYTAMMNESCHLDSADGETNLCMAEDIKNGTEIELWRDILPLVGDEYDEIISGRAIPPSE
ncbi:hypothetical protein EV426DRAFT_395351 [Tirmania nivea]|nr:hypothetical protein EV426DRAFT_395351 [Tirmania nivea]